MKIRITGKPVPLIGLFFVLLDATRIIVSITWLDHFSSNIEIFALFDTELLLLTKAPFSRVPNNSAPNFKDVEQRFLCEFN